VSFNELSPTTDASAPSSLLQFLPIIVIFGIFYFLLFMPMQRQKKQQAKMLAELKTGDHVSDERRDRGVDRGDQRR
jgi:ATP-dependent Zn protease